MLIEVTVNHKSRIRPTLDVSVTPSSYNTCNIIILCIDTVQPLSPTLSLPLSAPIYTSGEYVRCRPANESYIKFTLRKSFVRVGRHGLTS